MGPQTGRAGRRRIILPKGAWGRDGEKGREARVRNPYTLAHGRVLSYTTFLYTLAEVDEDYITEILPALVCPPAPASRSRFIGIFEFLCCAPRNKREKRDERGRKERAVKGSGQRTNEPLRKGRLAPDQPDRAIQGDHHRSRKREASRIIQKERDLEKRVTQERAVCVGQKE